MGGIPGIDAVRFVQQKEKLEREEAASKKKYRILVGQAFLDDELLKEKWAEFVTKRSEGFAPGHLLDDTIQIMGMVKAGVSTDKIREILSNMSGYKTVLEHLGAFLPPETMYEIDIDNKLDKALENLGRE